MSLLHRRVRSASWAKSRNPGRAARRRSNPRIDLLEERTLLTTVSVADITVVRGATGPSVVSGTISPGTATNGYRIDGSAGEMLKFHVDTFSSTSGNWDLYGPDNHFVAGSSFGTDFTASLPADGYYDLYLSGDNPVATPITYQFEVSDLTDAAISATGLNAPQSGTILTGGTTSYTFNASAGQKIYFDGRSAAPLNYALTDPSATNLFNSSAQSDQGPLTLAHSGTYSVQVSNTSGSTQTYAFNVIGLPSGATALTANTTTTGIDAGYGSTVFSFVGAPGSGWPSSDST